MILEDIALHPENYYYQLQIFKYCSLQSFSATNGREWIMPVRITHQEG